MQHNVPAPKIKYNPFFRKVFFTNGKNISAVKKIPMYKEAQKTGRQKTCSLK